MIQQLADSLHATYRQFAGDMHLGDHLPETWEAVAHAALGWLTAIGSKPEEFRGPRRQFEATIRVSADDLETMNRCLESALDYIAGGGRQSVMGGWSAGHIIQVTQDPSITHESWEQALNEYVKQLKARERQQSEAARP